MLEFWHRVFRFCWICLLLLTINTPYSKSLERAWSRGIVDRTKEYSFVLSKYDGITQNRNKTFLLSIQCQICSFLKIWRYINLTPQITFHTDNHIEVSSSTSPQEYLRPEDVSFQFAPQNMSENKKYTNPKPPHSTLYGSDLMNLDVSESITADPNTEQVFELPSSEDLSAFLADLALDEFCDSSEDGFGLLKARNSSQTTSESKDIARNLVCARLEGSRELGTKSGESAWLSVIPGVNTTWQSETNYTNTTTSSDIKHLLVSEGIRGERDYATQSALIEITEAWQTNSIELPRCGDISATDIVDRESGCLGNTTLSVYIPRNSSKSLYSLSSPSLVDILQIEGTTGRSICDVSDFPSSEDLEAFLANIESSDFPIEVRQSYLLNVSTGFFDAKNLQRKSGTTNEELHDSSFLQSKPAQSSRFVNAKKVQTTLGEKDIVFWQSPCQTEPNSSASSEISFEVHNSWFVDDSPITNCNDEYSRCSGSHSLGTEADSINSRRVVEQISQVHLDDLYGHTDGCKCNSETVNSSQFDKKGSSGFKTQHTNAFVANTSELKHQDDICALIDPTTSNAIPVNDSSDQSCLFLGSPELFSQSRSLFDNSTSCCNTPLLFTRTSPEEFSGSPEVEDNHCVTSLLLFPSSQSLHEPCSPIHSNTADTKSTKQSVLHHLSHSTPLDTNRCTLDATYANCEGNKQTYLHHLNHSTPLDTSHFGSTRVNRVLFSRCSFSPRYRTPVNRRSGICSVGKFSGPTSSVSFTSSLEDELLRYPNTPLLFSISSSSVTELNSVLYWAITTGYKWFGVLVCGNIFLLPCFKLLHLVIKQPLRTV